MQSAVDGIRQALASTATTEARLGVTAALLVALGAFALLVAPWVVDRAHRLVERWVFERESVPVAADDVRWYVPARAVVGALQLGAVLVVGSALLVLWGYGNVTVLIATALVSTLPTLIRATLTLLLIAAAVVGTDVLESWLTALAEGSPHFNEHQQRIVFRVLQVTLLIAAGLAILTVWNLSLGGLLVGAGFLGIVVGMAARQTLGSLIAGFVLMFSRPFEIGDWVEIGDREGIVTGITVVNTRIRTFDGEHVMLPNDEVSSRSIVNRTRQGRLRLEVEVGVDYDADPSDAADVAHGAVEGLDEILSVPRPRVVVKRFGDSAVVLGVRVWIDNPSARRKWRARTAVVEAVHGAFSDEGIAIPFPQRELSAREGEAVLAGPDGRAAGPAARPDGEPEPPAADPEAGSEADGGTDTAAPGDGAGGADR